MKSLFYDQVTHHFDVFCISLLKVSLVIVAHVPMPNEERGEVGANDDRNRNKPLLFHKSNPISIIVQHSEESGADHGCCEYGSEPSLGLPDPKAFMVVKEIRRFFYFFGLVFA